jgi:hypothetical protein
MPTTRRQGLNARLTFPTRNNEVSRFQKGGHCIEGLPSSIFQVIQLFLKEVNYRNLMNTNLSTFLSVKYETVHFTIIGKESDFCTATSEAMILHIVNSVKDKSKQITMNLKQVNAHLLRKYSIFFGGISKLFIRLFFFGEFDQKFFFPNSV